jgi:hypothetical protein
MRPVRHRRPGKAGKAVKAEQRRCGDVGGGGVGGGDSSCVMGVIGMKTVAVVQNLEHKRNRYQLYLLPIFVG